MNKLKFCICIILGLTFFSCNEEKWLAEKPYDFYAPENSYETVDNFKQAMNLIYDLVRYWHFRYEDNSFQTHHLFLGNENFYYGYSDLDVGVNMYHPSVNSTAFVVQKNWSWYYMGIAKANDILTRLETNASQVPDDAKLAFRGEALFFRAYYHLLLAHIFGDVPIVTEMLTAPKTDFTRATRDEVYAQCQQDLEEAIGLLDDIDQVVDGGINKQIAQHFLTEAYIGRKNYTKAIETANAVINHPKTGLMTERFGTRKDAVPDADVFYDLFREGNQNRSKGNTEGLWVLQYDYLSGSPRASIRSRVIMPQARMIEVMKKGGTDINDATHRVAACPDFTAEDGGRGNGYWATTHHFKRTIWGLTKADDRFTDNISDKTSDIRTSKFNIFRDYRIDNPDAEGHGQWLVKDGWLRDVDTFLRFYPAVTKYCAFEAYPDNSYKLDNGARVTTSLGKQILVDSDEAAIGSFKDEYHTRLAETYLLLAEAYVLNNQPDLAADAVNVVRSRAKAIPATAAEMNLDYILDERSRELATEEVRNITLLRMGKFVERARKYNPAGSSVADWQNLWPIPYAEIEKNTGAVLTQNQGYGAE